MGVLPGPVEYVDPSDAPPRPIAVAAPAALREGGGETPTDVWRADGLVGAICPHGLQSLLAQH